MTKLYEINSVAIKAVCINICRYLQWELNISRIFRQLECVHSIKYMAYLAVRAIRGRALIEGVLYF